MNDQSFDDAVMRISSKKNCPYDPEAFYFVRDGLNSAVKAKAGRAGKTMHVSGKELCYEIKKYALAEFGPMAAYVVRSWNLKTSSDIGEIVYMLINEGVFGKSRDDKREDFNGVFVFDEVLTQPYRTPDFHIPEDIKSKKWFR